MKEIYKSWWATPNEAKKFTVNPCDLCGWSEDQEIHQNPTLNGHGPYHEYIMEKPLFIPLKSVYYMAFENGEKTEELRKYGTRWNENTCHVGRKVILSKGYGKHSRMTGEILKFKVQRGTFFGSTYREAITAVFGTLDVDIACISISGLKPVELNQNA